MMTFIHCQVRDSRPYLLQMGFKRRGLSMMLVIILLHTCHFTGLVLSVSTDFVSMKGLKEALSNIRKNIARLQNPRDKDYKSYWAAFEMDEVSSWSGRKRRDILMEKYAVLKKNRKNPDLEKAARAQTLTVPLEDVRQHWIERRGVKEISELARFYGIFRDLVGNKEFIPKVWLDIKFPGSRVNRGTILTPSQCQFPPTIDIPYSLRGAYHSLLLVNPDGFIKNKNNEILHWMLGDIVNNDVSNARTIFSYIPPLPWKETGYHRFCFLLIQHKQKINVEVPSGRSLSSRQFNTFEFLESNHELDPVGLSWFQAAWDNSVSENCHHLGIIEPIFEWKKNERPGQARKRIMRELFTRKYTFK